MAPENDPAQTLRVAVLDDYQGRAPTLADWGTLAPRAVPTFFSQPIPTAELVDTLRDFEVLVLMRERTAFPRAILEQLPKLRLLITTGMGNASVDVGYLVERGVPVCGTASPPPTEGVDSTAELAWALILASVKHVVSEDRALRAGHWQLDLPANLGGRTLGLVGVGRLGSQMATIGRAFGMTVLGWSPNLTEERAQQSGVTAVSKRELFTRADVISVHLVLSPSTRGLIGAEDLALVKPSTVLVNTSRGPIVDEQALAEALAGGRLAGVGLDVFSVEPLPSDSPFRGLENAVLTPHLGYVSEPGLRNMYEQAVEDIDAYLAGTPLRLIT